MAKSKTRTLLNTDEKLYKAIQALFVLHARQIDMSNKDMREILSCDQADIDAIAKTVNKALKNHSKKTLNNK